MSDSRGHSGFDVDSNKPRASQVSPAAPAAEPSGQPPGPGGPEAPFGRSDEMTALLAKYPDTAHVDALFFDLCSLVRGKRYPVQDADKLFEDGMLIPYSAWLLDATGDCSDPGGRGYSDGDPDGVVRPVAGTLAPVPWSPVPSAQVMCSLDEDLDGPVVDPRNVLRRVERQMNRAGMFPVVALELEFYLIDQAERSPDGSPLPPLNPDTKQRDKSNQVYGMTELDDYAEFLRDVESACVAQSVPAYTATSENAPGQFEINLKHTDSAVRAADHAALLANIVERVANMHGFKATFMAKPYVDMAGNGLHIHLSVLDADGNNIFDDGTPQGSPSLRWAIGGLMEAMPESMALFAPNVNAYRRYAPNNYVPVKRAWGVNNRSVAFRIPGGPGTARRLEHRVCGASANPYLALAAVLAGACWGMENKLDPGPAVTGNACEQMDPGVPWTFRAALARLEKAHILPNYLGADYLHLYSETKWAELEKFQAVISPHEYLWYL
ncbi:glutamine synthetase family protein [Insolitispirillum peregrinum]|uniref:glutamine synthetase family protein n=1 Tax=Insolitispirillum peregrinum TaxID=80876 RepID=UPI00361883EB